jgi:hypothetical protein
VIPAHQTGILVGDVSCSSAPTGIELGSGSILDLADHTLSLTGTSVAVHCTTNRCTVRGGTTGGTIRTDQVAISGFNARISVRDVTVDIVPGGPAANAVESAGSGVLDLAHVRVTGAVGLLSIVAKRVVATNVDVSGTNGGIVALATLRGTDVTANATNGHGAYAGHNARLTRFLAHGNSLAGFSGDHLVIVDSDVNGNDVLFGDGIDLDTVHRPKLINTSCGHSHVANDPPGSDWGVCASD